MRKSIIISSLLLMILNLPNFGQSPLIPIVVKGLYPEGTAYDQKKKLFYISSVADGTIGTVNQNGDYKKFYQEKSLKSTYGMKVDEKRNRLWVCASDANYSNNSDKDTYKKLARLIALDLESGRKVADIDLSKLYNGDHFLNDLTLDNKGNIYVTDSYSPVIYKVDTEEKASVFLQNDIFKGEDVGLNGIVYNPAGFLLVDDGRDGSVYKVPLKTPSQFSKVKVNEFFSGCDGLIMKSADTLILIQNKGTNKVFKLASTDKWQTAKLTAASSAYDRLQQPSTGTFAEGKLYVLNSKLNECASPAKKPSSYFTLQMIALRPVP